MQRIILSATFLITFALGACSNERDVICDVSWQDADMSEIGTTQLVYDSLDDVNLGLEMCETDQETDDARPTDTVFYSCDCST